MQLIHVLQAIQMNLRQEILKNFRPDSCIASTRAVIRILKYYGYEAIPFPVQANLYNKNYIDAMLAGHKPPASGPALSWWCEKYKAWAIGVGVGDKEGGYHGHLVAIMPKERLMIDASLDQANRPQHDLIFPEVIIANVTDEFINEKKSLEFKAKHGAVMIYHPIDNPTWRDSPDWTDKSRTKKAVKAIVQNLEKKAG